MDMTFLELVNKRSSVREYGARPVPREVIEKCLEAARIAPSACNAQPFQFIVIHTKGREAELRRIYSASWFVQAPIVICACGIPGDSWCRQDGKNYCDIDVTIAMDHLILAATAEGLGTCWIGAFNPPAVRKVLNLPDGLDPIALTPLGYPLDDAQRPKNRKAISDFVRYID